jgi:hypothetical protein
MILRRLRLWQVAGATPLVGRESGLCLVVAGAGTANATAVDIWTCIGASNEKWARK